MLASSETASTSVLSVWPLLYPRRRRGTRTSVCKPPSNGSRARSHQHCSPRRPLLPESECAQSVSSGWHHYADHSRSDPVARPSLQILLALAPYAAPPL